VLAPVDCVVVVVIVPQPLPVQPVPCNDHVTAPLGFEPGTGVIVATIAAVPPAGTLAGAFSCSVKLLVIVNATDACFEGSATLCAVRTTLGALGRI
jgi:hypothetical protein